MNLEQSAAEFPETAWTLVGRAGSDVIAERRAALQRLSEVYWPAVYAFILRSGRRPDEAAEATQAFFTDVVLGRGLIARAERDRGRLRALMLDAIRNYLTDRFRRESARNRAEGIAGKDALEREESMLRSMPDLDPGAAFEKRWASAAVDEALARCERHFKQSGKERNWRVFESWIVRPSVSPSEGPALASLASELGFRTTADVSAAVQTVKHRFEAILREVVRETTETAEEAEQEYSDVLRTLG